MAILQPLGTTWEIVVVVEDPGEIASATEEVVVEEIDTVEIATKVIVVVVVAVVIAMAVIVSVVTVMAVIVTVVDAEALLKDDMEEVVVSEAEVVVMDTREAPQIVVIIVTETETEEAIDHMIHNSDAAWSPTDPEEVVAGTTDINIFYFIVLLYLNR